MVLLSRNGWMRAIGAAVMVMGVVRCVMASQTVPMEWSFEEARKCWTPMVRPVQHVGVPGFQFQTGVMWDGSLVFGPVEWMHVDSMKREIAPFGNHRLHLSVGYGEKMRFVDRKGSGNPSIRRWLEEGRLPIPHVETRDGDLVWQETVFAHLLNRKLEGGVEYRPGDMLVTQVRFKVRNSGYAKCTGHLWLHFGDVGMVQFGYKCAQADDIAAPIPHEYEAPYGIMDGKVRYFMPTPAKGSLAWHDEVPAPEGVKSSARSVIEWQVPLASFEEAELRLTIPYGLVDVKVGGQLAGLDIENEFAAVRAFWKDLQYGPGQITTPDPFVNDYLVAVAGQMAQQVAFRARSTGVWMYKTSPNFYEGYWPCNAAKALPAFDMRGMGELNRRILKSFIDCQTDDVRGMEKGALGQDQGLAGEGYEKIHGFLGNFGDWTANPLLLSHGLGMWALASHYRITRDDAWLNGGDISPMKAMIDAFDWVSRQRQRTMREVDGTKVPYWGLLPAASAHDWLAGNTIFNDAFCIYGMAEVVRVLRETNHPRADKMADELRDYRKCLRDRYAEARDQARPVPLSDGSSIPFVPRIVQELDWAKPDWTYTGYGPLRAGAWGALDPCDELVDQSLAFLEAGTPRGEGASLAVYLKNSDIADINWTDVSGPDLGRHRLWRHYVEYETMWPIGGPLFLARDDIGRYTEWLFHTLSIVLHRDWRVGVESLDGVPSCAPGDGERWQMIRRMFINETGGWDGSEQELFLLQAIPRSWLRPGNVMSVRDMGTWFGGTAGISVEVAEDGNSLKVVARLSKLAVKPKNVMMRLRSGDGRPLASAEVNGIEAGIVGQDVISLPTEQDAAYEIVGRFQ